MEFDGRSLFFIGDSITANGSFLSILRSHFKMTGRRIYVHNKGIAGANTDITIEALGETMLNFKPSYAVISLGVNDVGYWEYNSSEETSEEEEQSKQKRRTNYIDGIRRLTETVQEYGVCPILCSPFCVNRFLPQAKSIETVIDSKEKNAIDNSFYTSKAFEKINNSLGIFGNLVREYAEEKKLEFWDLFVGTFCAASAECFKSDGIHYSDVGDRLIADLILGNMLGERISEYAIDTDIEKIARLEDSERAYYFVKYNIMRYRNEGLSNDELLQSVTDWLGKNGNINGLTKARERGFFEFVTDNKEKQNKLIELIRKPAL